MHNKQRSCPYLTGVKHVERHHHTALTLLEVIFAIALTSIAMLLIGMAIDFQLRATESRRADAEQAQIVRSVLRQMSSDLRRSFYAKTTDFSNIADLSAVQIEELEAEIGENINEDDLSAIDESTDNLTNITSSLTNSKLPGLIGTRYALVFDIHHLPSRHELIQLASENELAKPAGGVTSVAYYLAMVQSPNTYNLPNDLSAAQPENGPPLSGLVRRAIDRATIRWAGDRGESDWLLDNTELMAPEVQAVEFRYFDGTEWLEQWNSDELLGLPVAVEIMIAFTPKDDPQQNFSNETLQREIVPSELDPDSIFRTVVRLPTARPVNEQALAVGEESTDLIDEGGSL